MAQWHRSPTRVPDALGQDGGSTCPEAPAIPCTSTYSSRTPYGTWAVPNGHHDSGLRPWPGLPSSRLLTKSWCGEGAHLIVVERFTLAPLRRWLLAASPSRPRLTRGGIQQSTLGWRPCAMGEGRAHAPPGLQGCVASRADPSRIGGPRMGVPQVRTRAAGRLSTGPSMWHCAVRVTCGEKTTCQQGIAILPPEIPRIH